MSDIRSTTVGKALELAGFASVPPHTIYDDVSVTPVVVSATVPQAQYVPGDEFDFSEAESIIGKRVLPDASETNQYIGAIAGLTLIPRPGVVIADFNKACRDFDVLLRSGSSLVPIPCQVLAVLAAQTGAAGASGFDDDPGVPAYRLPVPLAWDQQSAGAKNAISLYAKNTATPSAAVYFDLCVWFAGCRKNDAPDTRMVDGYQFGGVRCDDSASAADAIRTARVAARTGGDVDAALRAKRVGRG